MDRFSWALDSEYKRKKRPVDELEEYKRRRDEEAIEKDKEEESEDD